MEEVSKFLSKKKVLLNKLHCDSNFQFPIVYENPAHFEEVLCTLKKFVFGLFTLCTYIHIVAHETQLRSFLPRAGAVFSNWNFLSHNLSFWCQITNKIFSRELEPKNFCEAGDGAGQNWPGAAQHMQQYSTIEVQYRLTYKL